LLSIQAKINEFGYLLNLKTAIILTFWDKNLKIWHYKATKMKDETMVGILNKVS
jgi:hypothetical protein